jgi:hypothetical protein
MELAIAQKLFFPAESTVAEFPSSWCSLPSDIFIIIFEQLPPAHRCLLPQVCSAWRALASSSYSDPSYWRTLSLCRWGSALLRLAPPALHAHASAAHEAAAWRRYYIQRVAWFDLPTSPYQLIQEEQHGDPWRIMVACQVSSRTGGGRAKHDVLNCVLSAFPTPSAMMSAPKNTLMEMLNRVGMQDVRANALIRMSEGFLREWQLPSQLHGIGPFGQESVFLFQRGAAAWPSFKTNDVSLSLYLSWARKDLQKLGGGAEPVKLVNAFDAHVSTEEEAQFSPRKHAHSADCCAADASSLHIPTHSPAQAYLMSRLSPLYPHGASKRCASATSRVAAASTVIKRLGIGVPGTSKRPCRASVAVVEGGSSRIAQRMQLRSGPVPQLSKRSCTIKAQLTHKDKSFDQ